MSQINDQMSALRDVHVQLLASTKKQEAARLEYEAAVMVKNTALADETRARMHALLDHHLDLIGQSAGLGYEIILASMPRQP